ncbi:MAG: hypothetical protein JXA93_13930 [Anaerolineae bacterium]|nr:hypothetical protein [Anaerolineae bacterium]
MSKDDSKSIRLKPGEAAVVIDRELNTELVVRHEGGNDEPVSTAAILATALTVAINDDDALIHLIVDRFLERMEEATEEAVAVVDPDARLQQLAERYYNLLADQLYDPQPEVDGYRKETQRRYITNLLRNLAEAAASPSG